MRDEARDIQSESAGAAAAKSAIASITIQPRDLRPFIFRRWSATVDPGSLELDDSRLPRYWRARSKEKLVAKAIRRLRRIAQGAVVVVYEQPGSPIEGPDLAAASAVGSGSRIGVVASGAGSG
jgi:hypothetical protein